MNEDAALALGWVLFASPVLAGLGVLIYFIGWQMILAIGILAGIWAVMSIGGLLILSGKRT